MQTTPSLEDIRALLGNLPGPAIDAVLAWREREPQLTKPDGSLGRLEEIGCFLSAWQGRHPPRADRLRARILAGNHGVTALGVSAFPAAVTRQMVENYGREGACINQLCTLFGVELGVDALELERPTADFTHAPAMTEDEFLWAFSVGMGAVEPGLDLLVLGEMGIGNTTSAAAICTALYGGSGADWTGRGTGVDDSHLAIKTAAVNLAIALHGPALNDPLDVLRRLGGRELAAIAGAVLSARFSQVPVLLDGYVCTAAAAVLHAVNPTALDHCLVGHVSAEPGHQRLLEHLEQRPLLDLGMRLGEGSGAALAVGLVKAAVACHTGMATFSQAGVSDKG